MLVEILEDSWINPFEGPQTLLNIATGNPAQSEVAEDLLKAHDIGKAAYEEFQKVRLGPERSKAFHSTPQQKNLKTFTSMAVKKRTNISDQETILKADRKVFTHMLLGGNQKNMDMKDVLKYPLGPLPWALANCDGSLRCTDKSSLASALEKISVEATDSQHHSSACIIDGMSLSQKRNFNGKKFSEVSNIALMAVLDLGKSHQRIDVVFDTYQELSIKNAE